MTTPTADNQSVSSQKKNLATLRHLMKQQRIDITFSNISYTISKGWKCKGSPPKTIIKELNGNFRSGEFTAIMGISGAGKSTLMNALAGYKASQVSGTVTINGEYRNLRRFRKLSCYIMQDDKLVPYLSVQEAMMVSANLKLGKDVKMLKKKIIVEEILEALGLVESVNTRTMDLSGGQRKRLSVALELVNNPPVMFFDEPTSGLDSSSCIQIISLLKTFARDGRTIVCTIHQPSARIFEMFDNLYLLAQGQCIYQGGVEELLPFLRTLGYNCPTYHNPADFVMEVASGEYGDAVHKLVNAVSLQISNDDSRSNGTPLKSPTSTKRMARTAQKDQESLKSTKSDTVIYISTKDKFAISFFAQLWILFKRAFLTIWRHKLTQIRLFSHVFVGALIGTIYYDIGNDASKVMSNSGFIFFTTLFMMFTAMMPTLLTFPLEMAVLIREYLNSWYSLLAFYFARTLADLPFQISFSSAYVIVVYYLTSQPLETRRIAMFVFVIVLTSLVGQTVGLLIGAGLSVEAGVYFGPVLTIPLILFSGYLINFDAVPKYLRWLTYVSYMRYGFEGAMLSVYGMDRVELERSETYCHFRSPKNILEELSMDESEYWVDVVVLVGFLFGLRIIAYFTLLWKVQSMR